MTRFPAATERLLLRLRREVCWLGPRLFQLAASLPDMVSSSVTAYPHEPHSQDPLRALSQALYLRYYCGFVRPMEPGRDLLPSLRQANTGREHWSTGWQRVRDQPGAALVRRGLALRPVASEALRRGAGDSVEIRIQHEDVQTQPGFYFAFGESLADHYDDHASVRLYLHLTAAGAPRWLRAITSALNGYEVPFQFKVTRYAGIYARCDSGVLFVSRRHASFVASVLRELAPRVRGLAARVPPFTHALAPGLALADNPPGGESFGLTRMQLVAAAVPASGRPPAAARWLLAVAEQFRRHGLDPAQPWLNAGNAAVSLPPVSRRVSARQAPRATGPWLSVAERVGARLQRDALWYRNDCTWLGASTRDTLETLGPELYGGLAGVGLFLALLWAHTRAPRLRRCALAAFRQARTQLRAPARALGVGAYTGLAGVLWAVVESAEALDSDELRQLSCALLRQLRASRPAAHENDILGGRAGAIRALLHVARRRRDLRAGALALAERFGHELVAQAHAAASGSSWQTLSEPTAAHLLGYSHGTAGIALALQELQRVRAHDAFAGAAAAAWEYERAHFDSASGNWPDFRGVSAADGAAAFSNQWCHGAAGTALALARCAPAGLPDLLPLARATLLASLSSPIAGSFSLCHGVAGNAECLGLIEQAAGAGCEHPAVLAAAQAGAERHGASDDWPSGVPGGMPSPSLMLGTAGIGLFYLRLHDPRVPSALTL